MAFKFFFCSILLVHIFYFIAMSGSVFFMFSNFETGFLISNCLLCECFSEVGICHLLFFACFSV